MQYYYGILSLDLRIRYILLSSKRGRAHDVVSRLDSLASTPDVRNRPNVHVRELPGDTE